MTSPAPAPAPTARLAILSPGFPSVPGGVTDHTQRLVRSWSAAGHSVEVLGRTDADADSVTADLAGSGVTALLVQYVPFLYGRRGLSGWPERVARAARSRGIRVTLFVHEPWVPLTRLPWLVLGPLQRRQLRRLVRVADRTVTAVPAWRDLLGAAVDLVYVGSNLGSLPPTVPAPLSSPVVFSPTAAGFRFDWVAAAAHAIGASPGLVCIGIDASAARHHPGLAAHFDSSWDWRGRLSATDALGVMARARLVLAPFEDGATGRRTSLLAAVSSGARVLSTTGPLFDPVFREGPILLAGSQPEFRDLAVRVWKTPDHSADREARLRWHRTHMEPSDLDARLLRITRGEP